MTEVDRANVVSRLSEATLMAILPAAALWLTFVYESSYVGYFGVPASLIEVGLQGTLVVATILAVSLWSLVLLLNFACLLWPDHPVLQVKLIRSGSMLLYPSWQILNYGFRISDLPLYIVAVILALAFEFLWPLIVYRGKGTLFERIVADENAEDPVRRRGVFGRIETTFG